MPLFLSDIYSTFYCTLIYNRHFYLDSKLLDPFESGSKIASVNDESGSYFPIQPTQNIANYLAIICIYEKKNDYYKSASQIKLRC